MKGTLFSADFVKDAEGSHKLLEINTDTACIAGLTSHIDFTDFYGILATNSIADLQVIYKRSQTPIIEKLEAQKPAGVTITKTLEHPTNIYPTTITDSDAKFILRLAYDENALLDVVYAKKDTNLHGLFYAADSGSAIIPAYYSSSAAGYDTLERYLNEDDTPDFVIKKATPTKNGLGFYKVGGTGTGNENMTAFIEANKSDEVYITNYLTDGTDTAKSTRSYQIVYGASLDINFLGEYELDALLTHTEDIVFDITEETNLLSNKHYYEFATNDITELGGIHKDEIILKDNLTGQSVTLLPTGSLVDSYFVSGSPDTDDFRILDQWSFDGDTIPSGSYNTSSIVEFKTETVVPSNAVRKLTLAEGSVILTGGGNRLLAYDESTTKSSFKIAKEIVPTDKLYRNDGSTVAVTGHDVIILDSNADSSVYELGVEDVDNYVLSGSNVILHNAPCFLKGTMVDTSEGARKIEDIEVGDFVLGWDFDANEYRDQEVMAISETENKETIDITLTRKWENGGTDTYLITCTADHPYYAVGKGWSSYDPTLLKENGSELSVKALGVGDEIFTGKTETHTIASIEPSEFVQTVYNLDETLPGNVFFVAGALVHNRAGFSWGFGCFSKGDNIEMFDGSLKAIDKVVKGDEIKSSKNGKDVKGIVTEALVHPTNDVVQVVKVNGITAEANHPILVNGEWVAASTLGEVTTEFIENWYNLEVDGNVEDSEHNYIIGGLVASGLGDNAKLNAQYQRQAKELTNHLN